MREDEIVLSLASHPETKALFRTCCARDEILTYAPPRPGIYIVNSQARSHVGEHWILVFITPQHEYVYFDSFGLPPLMPEIYKFLQHKKKITYNSVTLQHLSSDTCGEYCVYAGLTLARGKTLAELRRPFLPYPALYNDRLIRLLHKREHHNLLL